MAYVVKARKPNDPTLYGNGLTPNEKKLVAEYVDALKRLNVRTSDPDVMRRIIAAVQAGNPMDAADLVPWATFTQSLEPVVAVMSSQVVNSANLSAQALPTAIRFAQKFTLTDPRAIAWAQVRTGATIRQVNQYSREAVAQVITNGLRSKIDIDTMIAEIKKVVGLDQRQAVALSRLYENTIAEGIANGMSRSAAIELAEKRGTEYRNRLWKQRAERIARTETLAAANQGRMLSWIEADQQGLLPAGSQKQWVTALDERTCPICGALHRAKVPWDASFSTGLMPPAHPNCRCTAVILPAAPGGVAPEVEAPTKSYGGYDLKDPKNTTGTDRGQATVAAKNLRDRAVVAEPQITRDMVDLANEKTGRLEGLENRVKSTDSLARKIEGDAKLSNVAVASGKIHDTVRYTMVFPNSTYARSTQDVIDELRAKGYEIRTKNNWTKGNPYFGVNAQVVTPTGVKMELQFHTEGSLDLKNRTHDVYAKWRVGDDEERRMAEMVEMGKFVKFPSGDLASIGDSIPLDMKKVYDLLSSISEAL